MSAQLWMVFRSTWQKRATSLAVKVLPVTVSPPEAPVVFNTMPFTAPLELMLRKIKPLAPMVVLATFSAVPVVVFSVLAAPVTVTVPLSVDISNIGGRGVSGDLEVQFWQGRPDIGTHLGSVILNAQNAASLPVVANFAWPNVAPGVYRIYAYIPPAPDDADVDNNQIFIQVSVPVARTFLPAIRRR